MLRQLKSILVSSPSSNALGFVCILLEWLPETEEALSSSAVFAEDDLSFESPASAALGLQVASGGGGVMPGIRRGD